MKVWVEPPAEAPPAGPPVAPLHRNTALRTVPALTTESTVVPTCEYVLPSATPAILPVIVGAAPSPVPLYQPTWIR